MADASVIDLQEDIDAGELRRILIPSKLPRSERHRTVFGRSVDLGRIQSALLQADGGVMVELTDLESEMMALDPHLSAVNRKRVGSVQCLPWRIDPATGSGVDDDLAEEIADVVRQHLNAIPRFTERFVDLAWATYYNRAALEIHWTMQSGKVRWRPKALEWVHPRRLAFGPERELRLINTQRRRGDFVEQGFALQDFPGKFVSWQPRLFGEYPEREGNGPRCLYWAFFKRFSWRMRMALTELFGIPWRIVETDKDAPVNADAITSAFEAAEKLGETTSAAFGQGMKLNIPSLGEQRGELFGMNSEEVNAEMSKLVLGQTSTTESDANRANSIIGKGEQDIILASDALGIEGSIQRDLIAVIVVLNYGAEAIAHCPNFVLDATTPRDAAKEQARIKEVVMLGVPVSVAEIRETGGTREPADDEAFVVAESPGLDATGKALPPVPVLVDPVEQAEAEKVAAAEAAAAPAAALGAAKAPTVKLAPTDLAKVVTVDEARASSGLGPLLLPDGTPDPDGSLTLAEFAEKRAAKGAGEGELAVGADGAAGNEPGAPAAGGAPPPPAAPPTETPPADGALESADDLADAEGDLEDGGVDRQDELAEAAANGLARQFRIPLPAARLILARQRPITLDAVDRSIDENHGHSLRIADEDIDARGQQTYSIKGAADHDHMVTLTVDDMQVLFDGEQVNVLSTEGGRGNHSHNVTIEREGANVDKPGDIDGGIDEFSRGDKGDAPGRPLAGSPLLFAPEGPFGSPGDLVDSGAVEGGSIIAGWIDKLVKAIERSGLAAGNRALEAASEKLDVDAFAGAVERTALRSSMLGALDADEEPQRGGNVPVEKFTRIELRRSPFTQTPFQEAIDFFNSRKVVTPEVFEAMADDAKTRAFTVAGAASEDVVRVVRDELRASLTAGVDLRTFKAQLQERLELSGWLGAGRPAHVETIYRNGVMGSYGSGREQQMLQPAVLAARPFWQIRTVSDGRRRKTHGDVHLKVFAVGGTFLSTSGRPPYGHNCRCRAVSLSAKQAEAIGVSEGETFDLPDPGWTPNVILT